MLFYPFLNRLIFTVNQLPDKHCLFESNHRCLFYYLKGVFGNIFIGQINLLSLLISIDIFTVLIINRSKVETFLRYFSSQFLSYIFSK